MDLATVLLEKSSRRMVCVSMPGKLLERLDARCRKEGVRRSRLVRLVLEQTLDELDHRDRWNEALGKK